ncbi:MAG: trypsin-like serine protease [Coleofasciculaceae cyanobacterium]
MSTIKRNRILPLLAGASCLLSFNGITPIVPVTAQGTTPQGVLSPNDPAAKLSPNLVNVPSVVAPTPSSTESTNLSAATAGQAVGYNPATGTSQIIPKNSNELSPSFNYPNFGSRGLLGSESRARAGSSQESVIGPDNRIFINSTTIYPWRAQAKLFITFPDGITRGCSGTLIQAKYLLTAGHCVHNKDYGGWYTKIEVVPGLNNTYKPYGSAFASYARSYNGWINSKNRNYDMALVTLDRNIGSTTGWLGYKYYSTINGVTGNIAGYPGDKGGLKLYYHSGPIASSTSKRVSYSIDTNKGQSGSGVYRITDGKRYVFAVHTNGTSPSVTTNSGTRLDSAKVGNISSWIATGF